MIELFPSREIALNLFGWSIRWYGVLYVVAIWLAWALLPRLQKYRGLNLTRDQWTYLLSWAAAGVLIGGRLGYVVFYEPAYFIAHPGEVIALWSGGMSSHGGFIGVGLALWYVSKKLEADVFSVLDIVVVPTALGLALGRVGNGINQELFIGNAWLYAVAANLVVAGVCYVSLRGTLNHLLQTLEAEPPKFGLKIGNITALFLILYSIQRFLIEYIRIQEWPLTFGLTRGQLLTIPVFLIGAFLFYSSMKQNSSKES